MTQTGLLIWLGWILCLMLSFILSGMEAGVFALNRVRLRHQARSGQKAAVRLTKCFRDPEQFLWTLFVGNTLVNFFALAWMLMVLESLFREIPVVLWGGFALVVFVFHTVFDLLPKTVFRASPNRLCAVFSGPVRAVHLVLRPLVKLVEWGAMLLLGWRREAALSDQLFGNREELRVIMQESARGFTSDERTLINRVLDLHSVTVRHVMKPIQLAVTVNMETTLAELFELARDKGLSRFPVWEMEAGIQRIAGIIDLDTVIYRDDLALEASVARFVTPSVFLSQNLPVENALRRMRRGGQPLAVVVGPKHREVGILAMQDVLERIFGEMEF